MGVMDWDANKFDVLVPKMNEQHHKIVDMMNKLFDRHGAKAPKSELNKLIVDLRDYTIQHFKEEETMLEAMKFPQLARHKDVHKKLLEDFTTHYNTFSAGTGAISPAFFEFLRLWLTSHIMHIDRKYGEFQRDNKGSAHAA